MGNQSIASRLMDDIMIKKYDRFFEFCKTGEAFQDIPFTVPGFYKILDREFPNSKFILTVRNDEEQWYNSILKFHSKLFSNGNVPTEKDILKDKMIYTGWRLKVLKYLYGESLYSKEFYKNLYTKHNKNVKDYFKDRNEDFLEINVSKNTDYIKLISFLGVSSSKEGFPWENKTNK